MAKKNNIILNSVLRTRGASLYGGCGICGCFLHTDDYVFVVPIKYLEHINGFKHNHICADCFFSLPVVQLRLALNEFERRITLNTETEWLYEQ